MIINENDEHEKKDKIKTTRTENTSEKKKWPRDNRWQKMKK